MMASYYKKNEDSLPSNIRNKREHIIRLIMDGLSVEDAFAQAVDHL